MSKLGVFWSVEHRRKEDYTYFSALQPAVHLIMDGGAPDYTFVRDNEPNTTVLARDWALSEQHSDMLADPVGTGKRHAFEWSQHQVILGFDRRNTLILGINEPTVWQPGYPEALRQYTITLCAEAKKYGLRVGAMQLGVGWPGNNGPDTPPDWSPFHGVEQAILDNGGALVTHEYWADKGPFENWGWWGGRTLKCPWQVPIIIGEAGVDMFVKDTSVGQQNRGWLGHMSPERYATELWEYTNRMAQDSRFVGCCVFASDFQAHEWYSFDVQPAYNAILAVKPTDTSPVTVHLPSVSLGNGPIPAEEPKAMDNWERAWPIVLDIEGGLSTDPNDRGNYRPDGTFVGTRWGISANAHPDVDILNLTKEQALDIYKREYWQESGAWRLEWPMSLAVFDLAVNGGVGRAKQALAEAGQDFEHYNAWRLRWYTSLDQFNLYGPAWVRRVAKIMESA